MALNKERKQQAPAMEEEDFMLGSEQKDIPLNFKSCAGIATVLKVIMVFALIRLSRLNIFSAPADTVAAVNISRRAAVNRPDFSPAPSGAG